MVCVVVIGEKGSSSNSSRHLVVAAAVVVGRTATATTTTGSTATLWHQQQQQQQHAQCFSLRINTKARHPVLMAGKLMHSRVVSDIPDVAVVVIVTSKQLQ
eukprot:17155-Heterococcus_DN1.PRE.1